MKERYVIPSPGNSLENNIKSVPLNIWNGPCFSNNFTVKWLLLIFVVLFWILSQISNILMPNAAYSHNSLLAPSSFPYSAWHLIVLQHCFGGPWYNVLHYSIQMSILLVQLMYLSSGISCLSFCWMTPQHSNEANYQGIKTSSFTITEVQVKKPYSNVFLDETASLNVNGSSFFMISVFIECMVVWGECRWELFKELLAFLMLISMGVTSWGQTTFSFWNLGLEISQRPFWCNFKPVDSVSWNLALRDTCLVTPTHPLLLRMDVDLAHTPVFSHFVFTSQPFLLLQQYSMSLTFFFFFFFVPG